MIAPLRLLAPVCLALLISACVRPIAPESGNNCDNAKTTGEMSECAMAEVQALEQQLQAAESGMLADLERIAATSPGDTGTGRTIVEEFGRSQATFNAYKEAECSYAYSTAFGGSIRGLYAALCLRELLKQRLERVVRARNALPGSPPQ